MKSSWTRTRSLGRRNASFTRTPAKIATATAWIRAVLFEVTCPDQQGGTCGDTGQGKLLCRPGKQLHFHESGKSRIPAPELDDRALSGLAQGLGPRSFEALHSELERHHSTFPEQPDHVLLRDGRSSGYDQRQERRWSFLLGGYVLHCGGGSSGNQDHESETDHILPKGSSVMASYTCSDPKTSEAIASGQRHRPIPYGGDVRTEPGAEPKQRQQLQRERQRDHHLYWRR